MQFIGQLDLKAQVRTKQQCMTSHIAERWHHTLMDAVIAFRSAGSISVMNNMLEVELWVIRDWTTMHQCILVIWTALTLTSQSYTGTVDISNGKRSRLFV